MNLMVLFQTSDLDDTSSRDSQDVSRVPCLHVIFSWDGLQFLSCLMPKVTALCSLWIRLMAVASSPKVAKQAND